MSGVALLQLRALPVGAPDRASAGGCPARAGLDEIGVVGLPERIVARDLVTRAMSRRETTVTTSAIQTLGSHEWLTK